MYQAKSGVKIFSLYWQGGGGGGGGPSTKIFFFSSLNMYQAKSGVKNFSLYQGVKWEDTSKNSPVTGWGGLS